MLSFRNKLVKTDPEVIRQIAASTGFFDRQDVQINVEIAENLLNQKDSEHKFLFVPARAGRLRAAYRRGGKKGSCSHLSMIRDNGAVERFVSAARERDGRAVG